MTAFRWFAIAALAAGLAACALQPGEPAQRVALGSRLTVADPSAGTPMRFQDGRRVATVDRWQRPYCILRGAAAPEYRVSGFRLETVPTGRVVTRFIDANAQRVFGGEIVEYRSRLALRTDSGGVASLTCATREEVSLGSYLSRREIRGVLGEAAALTTTFGILEMRMIHAARLAALALMFTGAALAHSFEVGNLHIGHPWARATPPGATTAAVYFTVASAEGTDRLVAVSTPAAEHAAMHRSMEKQGMAAMKPVDAAPVSPQAPLEFAPGGYHVMLTGLKEPLVEGDRFPMTLRFANAGEVTVEVVVEAMAFSDGKGHGHSH